MKLATSSYTWGKLQSEEETGAMLDDVVKAGLRYLALQPADLLPGHLLDDPGIFEDQARSRGVEIIALGGLAHDLNSQLARAFDVDLMWAVVDSRSMDDWVRDLLALADDVSALNVTLNVHPHLKSPIESLEEIKEFFSRVRVSGNPEIRLCLDPGHYAGARVDVLKVIDEFRDDIGMVHVTDFLPPANGRPIVFEETFVDLGEGIVDYPPILRKLAEVGYDGWYIIEAHYPKNLTPMETVRLNRERFEDLVARSS